jgi:prepilin-type N-terminal cleavage/methylation domain-containing protein
LIDSRRKKAATRAVSRGFSLVELLAVVTISGLLAVAGVAMFRRHIVASRGSEATSFLQGLRAAESMYMSENHGYLNASIANGGTAWYPQATPVNQRAAWANESHVDWPQWQQFGLPLNKTVLFSYLANAGVPNTANKQLASDFKNQPGTAVQPLDWYVLQARGDTDGNGVYALYYTTSMAGEIFSENDGD